MRIAYLDCFSGISGDMFLGALLDAGVPFALFEKTVADLNIGATLEISRVDRGGISATKLDVIVNGEKDLPREEFWERQGQGTGVRGQTEVASGQWFVVRHPTTRLRLRRSMSTAPRTPTLIRTRMTMRNAGIRTLTTIRRTLSLPRPQPQRHPAYHLRRSPQ